MMSYAYKRKNGDEGELADGTQSGKSTAVPVQQVYCLPSCHSPNRFPQGYAIVVPLPCYFASFNSPEDSDGSNMRETSFYKELESLLDEPTMPSWEEFVSGLDAQASTMPSSEGFGSNLEEMANTDTELREITMEPCEGVRSVLQPNGMVLEANAKELNLTEKMKELETKAEEIADMTESLLDYVFKDFEVNAKDPEENASELETKVEGMAAMTMTSLASSQLEDTGFEGSARSWSKEEEEEKEDEEPPIENTKESDEIFQRNNDESPPVIEQGGLISERLVRRANARNSYGPVLISADGYKWTGYSSWNKARDAGRVPKTFDRCNPELILEAQRDNLELGLRAEFTRKNAWWADDGRYGRTLHTHSVWIKFVSFERALAVHTKSRNMLN